MVKEERFQHILQKLADDRKVTLNQLSTELFVSEDTIRRDIEELARNGQLKKVRGGAIPHSPNAPYHAFNDRIHVLEHDKQFIAQKAVNLLMPGQVIFLDGGTTTYAMAGLIPHNIELTVVTNNIPAAALLSDHPTVQVIMAGGKVLKSSRITLGMETTKMMSSIRADIFFTGICSLHHAYGITGPDLEESEIKKVMVANAGRVVAVTTLNKIGTAEPYHICHIADVDTIITEAVSLDEAFEPYKNLGITII